ncbi:MAG TPA: hypothetical protein VH370_00095 [Humisphaera sp.]|jgi:uncharacterized delta-60 repeat protein|nr:hypothetical protein [Humisphaera sp.]
MDHGDLNEGTHPPAGVRRRRCGPSGRGGSGALFAKTAMLEPLEARVLLSGHFPADPSFANNGILSSSGPMEVQSDGKILVDVGGAGNIIRLNSDGSVDNTFNPAGAVDDWKPSAARQPDGKLLLLNNGVLTRYNTNGNVDQSFGTGGAISSFYTNSDVSSFTPQVLAMRGSKIIVGGWTQNATPVGSSDRHDNSDTSYAVERYNPDGTIDSSFGLHTIEDGSSNYSDLTRVRVNPQTGDIVASGYDEDDNGTIVDFGVNGPDGTSGVAYRQLGEGKLDDLAIAPDGTIVAVGGTYEISTDNFDEPGFIVRLTAGFQLIDRAYIAPPHSAHAGVDDFDSLAITSSGWILVGSTYSSTIMRLIPDEAPVPPGVLLGTIVPAAEEAVSWQAYIDLNNDGIYETGEPTGSTDAYGFYGIGSLAPGHYILREVRQPGFVRTQPAGEWPAGNYSITLNASAGQRGLDFSNYAAPISGQVKVDQGPGVAATPIAGVGFFLDLNDNGVVDAGEPTTATDSSGNWLFPTKPSGSDWEVRLQLPQGAILQSPASGIVPADSEDSLAGLNFLLEQIPGQTIDVNASPLPSPQSVSNDGVTLTTYGAPTDLTFGDQGEIAGYPGPMIVQSDGSILVDVNGSGNIVRFNPDGSLDSSFNSAGIVDYWKPHTAQQADGKLLVLSNGTLTRYNTDGTIDTSFGNSGKISQFYISPDVFTFTPQQIAVVNGDIAVVGSGTARGDFNVTVGMWAVDWYGEDGLPDAAKGMSFTYPDQAGVGPPKAGRVLSADCVAVDPRGDLAIGGTDADHNVYVVYASVNTTPLPFKGTITALVWDNGWAAVGEELDTARSWYVRTISWGGIESAFLLSGPARQGDNGSSFHNANSVFFQPNGDAIVGDAAGTIIRILPEPYGSFTPPPFSIYGLVNIFPSASQWQVYVDLNNNGNLDAGEPTAWTDANGNYDIHFLTDGTYRLREVSQSGFTQAKPQAQWPAGFNDVIFPLGYQYQIASFDFVNVVSPLSGFVTTDGKTAAAGMYVYLDLNGDGVPDGNDPLTTSDAQGYYAFGALPAQSQYAVRLFLSPSQAVQYPNATTSQTAAAGAQVQNVDFALEPPADDTSNGPPVVSQPAPQAGGSTPPLPTTIAGFRQLLVEDHAALAADRKQRRQQMTTARHTLSADTNAYRHALRQLKLAQRHQSKALKANDTEALSVATSDAAAAQALRDQLAQTVTDDRTALASLLHSDPTGIDTARQKITDDQQSYRTFLRSQRGK